MNRDSLLSLYDRFTQLVEKLPGGLQKPILRELTPIRNVFFEQRPARLVLLGDNGSSVPEILFTVCRQDVETGKAENGWRRYRIPNRGEVLVLDARSETPQPVVESALAGLKPDAALLVREPGEESPATLESAAARIALCPEEIPIVGLTRGSDSDRAKLAATLAAHREFSRRRTSTHSGQADDSLAESLCALLPDSARLEFARLAGAKKAQTEIAGSLLKSFTAVCGVIGLQPIPLADMPILTALQTLMVSLIIHTSGKTASPRLVAEFLAALGLSIGAGMLFRESARAIVKIIPIWGNAVSGFVAGVGTYAIGRAAIAYFIEDTPLTETKKLFHRLLPGWDTFRRRRLPESKTGDRSINPKP